MTFQKIYQIRAVPASRPKVPRYGHPYYPKRYMQFRKDWALITHNDWPMIFLETKDAREYEFSYEAWFDKHPVADIDNLFKALTDTLVKAKVIPDDNLICRSYIDKHFHSGKEQVKITIRKIN
ncbi:MAG: RusA family crossover junction endodeoxyribonuclease [Oenococcus oeni]